MITTVEILLPRLMAIRSRIGFLRAFFTATFFLVLIADPQHKSRAETGPQTPSGVTTSDYRAVEKFCVEAVATLAARSTQGRKAFTLLEAKERRSKGFVDSVMLVGIELKSRRSSAITSELRQAVMATAKECGVQSFQYISTDRKGGSIWIPLVGTWSALTNLVLILRGQRTFREALVTNAFVVEPATGDAKLQKGISQLVSGQLEPIALPTIQFSGGATSRDFDNASYAFAGALSTLPENGGAAVAQKFVINRTALLEIMQNPDHLKEIAPVLALLARNASASPSDRPAVGSFSSVTEQTIGSGAFQHQYSVVLFKKDDSSMALVMTKIRRKIFVLAWMPLASARKSEQTLHDRLEAAHKFQAPASE